MNAERDLIRINLGCGAATADEMLNVDILPGPGVDVVCDLDVAPWPWKDGAASYLFASHVFEHLREPVQFMAEAWRVLTEGGLLVIHTPGGGYVNELWIPHIDSFTDPTHLRHCTPATWDYWVPGRPLHKQYGAGFGSPPVVFEIDKLALGHPTGQDLEVVLRKVEHD